MMIVHAYPPMIDEIDKAFKTRGKDVIYCWGATIYAPHSDSISPALQAHEAVHRDQQAAGGPEPWWRRYIDDTAFRQQQEIPAHRTKYQRHAKQANADQQVPGFRSRRLYHLHHIASRLSGPLYGGLISRADAIETLKVA